MAIDDVFKKLTKGIVLGNAKVIFEDRTGVIYEIPEGLVSVISKSYLLVGHGNYSIPIILVMQDLSYPFRRAENMLDEIQRGIKLLESIIEHTLSEDYRSRIMLIVLDARVVDAPLSLNQVELVP